ncbi:MAG: cytochrome b [Betaproteobacteria bacterium]
MSGNTRYSPVAIALHWWMAAFMLALLASGFVMDDLPQGGVKFAAFNTHKLFGAVVLVLAAVRLAWRVGHQPPAADDLPAWQRRASHAAHAMLYVAMIVLPVSGLLFTNFGKGVRIFALTLAPIGGPDEALSHLFKDVHEATGIVLAVIVSAHVVAALWHHFGRRDATLVRILPGARFAVGD